MQNAIAVLIGRILLAAVFIPAGVQKLMGGIDGTAGMIAGAGLPAATALAYAAAIFEIVAGHCLLEWNRFY